MTMRFLMVAAAAAAAIASTTIANSAGTLTQKQALAQGMTVTRKLPVERPVGRLIVKLRDAPLGTMGVTARAARVKALEATAGTGMAHVRELAGGASLMALGKGVPLGEAKAVAARLVRDPTVEYAEPDIIMRKLATPNDTRFLEWQWNLHAPTSTFTGYLLSSPQTKKSSTAVGGINMPPAWDVTTGSNSVVVAVIDTGIVNHPDLNGITSPSAPYTPSGRFVAGYDFISPNLVSGAPANFVANDGDGRDPDPTDAGDWVTTQEETDYPSCDDEQAGPQDSSWHGTHMAGVVAATANNALGTAGVAWNVRVQPIRALGKCGGALSDIADAIQWAAGLSVPGVPANATPARVISLSLGGEDCNVNQQYMRDAVNAARNAGSVVIAATGNDGADNVIAPANCPGVIAVTAHTINGENADYANVGTVTAISAPGGGKPFLLGAGGPTDDSGWTGYWIWSTALFGPTTPGSMDSQNRSGPSNNGFVGTSPATPHVAGVAALLISQVPNATPNDIRAYLTSASSVRPFPAGSACAPGGPLAGKCGAGLLDARLALNAVVPTANAGVDQVVAPGALVTLNGSGSTPAGNSTITTYEWTQTAGTPTVTLSAPTQVSTTFTAPSTGNLTFRLRVTDNLGKQGEDSVTVRVNSPPSLSAAPAAQSAAQGQVITFSVSGSDPDNDSVSYVATSGSTVPLTALAPNGVFTWNTSGVAPGTYTLVYFATDGFAQSATQSVSITVGGGAPAPTSGGGGALPLAQLLLLAALGLAAQIRRRN